jgi:hypothetical protein
MYKGTGHEICIICLYYLRCSTSCLGNCVAIYGRDACRNARRLTSVCQVIVEVVRSKRKTKRSKIFRGTSQCNTLMKIGESCPPSICFVFIDERNEFYSALRGNPKASKRFCIQSTRKLSLVFVHSAK